MNHKSNWKKIAQERQTLKRSITSFIELLWLKKNKNFNKSLSTKVLMLDFGFHGFWYSVHNPFSYG